MRGRVREGDFMSLVDLIKRPGVREAFERLATAERTPAHMGSCPILVPDGRGPHGLTGTAFDFVARAQIIRDLKRPGTKFFEGTTTASRIEDHIEMVPLHPEHEERIRDGIRSAKHEAVEYAAGSGGGIRRLVEQSQYYALAERAYRGNRIPDAEFRPIEAVSNELLRLLELFDPGSRYASCTLCILNPEFVASRWVGGADADFVVDGTLVDLKTTANHAVTVDMLRQMAGYAALQTMGGIKTDDGPHATPFERVELYFARYATTATWAIADLFPKDGFEQFCDVVRGIVDADRKQFDEMMERIARRQAEDAEQKKLARAKARKKRKTKTTSRTKQ